MIEEIANAVDDVQREGHAGEVAAGGIVHAVHPDSARKSLRPQRVHEGLADTADAWRFGGASRECHSDVRAWLC